MWRKNFIFGTLFVKRQAYLYEVYGDMHSEC